MLSVVVYCKLSLGLETNRKGVFTCAEEAYDIQVDVCDCQYLLTFGASTYGQVKEEFT